MVREDLSRVGRLILVSDCLHLPPCGVGRKPDSLEGTAGSTGSSQWVGDSSKWSQEKKILSMHPDLRPLVEEVIHGMTRRGFQPTIFFGWRSVAVQLEIFKKKHTRVRFSFHNVQKKDGIPDAYAADIVDRRGAGVTPHKIMATGALSVKKPGSRSCTGGAIGTGPTGHMSSSCRTRS
jgi:hypothetical protein